MTPTTKPPAEVGAALDHQQVLAEARAHLAGLRERVGAGDQSVTAAQVAEAEDAVHLAELRIEAAADIAARAAEERRLARIEEIRRSLVGGFLHDEAAEVLARFDKAVEACAELYAAKQAYETTLAAGIGELWNLRPLPAGMSISGSPGDRRVVVDGRAWRPSRRYSVALVAEAAGTGIDLAAGGRAEGRGDLHRAVGGASRVERFRRLVGVHQVDDVLDDHGDEHGDD